MTLPLAQAALVNDTPTWLWLVFGGVVVVVMAIDLGIAQRQVHRMETREALLWVGTWVSLAFAFNTCIWIWMGPKRAVEFLAGYLVELNLSVDNLFVFLVIFSYFSVPPEYHRRVLTWGILGAVIMRLFFIFVGMALVRRFHWFLYIFGAILLYTGLKLLRGQSEVNPEKNPVLRLARKILPVTKEFHGEHFFVREADVGAPVAGGRGGEGAAAAAVGSRPKARLVATPLFLVLLVVEATDVVFAVDSVPAILSLTDNLFIAFTSNVFAILGLRAMYFVLTSFLDKFHYLKYGLSLVLIFLGAKMLLDHWIEIPAAASLTVVVLLLGSSVAVSLLFPPRKRPLEPEESPGNGEGTTSGGN